MLRPEGDQMAANSQIDRGAIRSIVEDFWRSFLVTSVVNPESAENSIGRFDAQIRAMASVMSEEQSKTFLAIVAEEREMILQESARNPENLRTRLGLSRDRNVENYALPASRARQGLGELAVRTAVRATVWKSVGAVFRFFR